MNTEVMKYSYVKDFYSQTMEKKISRGEAALHVAVRLAYDDLKRTVRGFSKCEEKEHIKNEITNLIITEYEQIFSTEEKSFSFNKFHRRICEKIILLGKGWFTIGQAQKWVNMFFKYMLTVDERLNKHIYCLHMPLDGVILDGIIKHGHYFRLTEQAKKCVPWSKLSDYDAYLKFQELAQEAFYPFAILIEFRLWHKWSNGVKTRFDDLTAFIDYFANTNNEFYIKGKGYSKECEKFLIELNPFMELNYIDLRKKYGLEFHGYNNTDFEDYTAHMILILLTFMVRNMHWGSHEALEDWAKSGIIYHMLKRLQDIDNGMGTKEEDIEKLIAERANKDRENKKIQLWEMIETAFKDSNNGIIWLQDMVLLYEKDCLYKTSVGTTEKMGYKIETMDYKKLDIDVDTLHEFLREYENEKLIILETNKRGYKIINGK